MYIEGLESINFRLSSKFNYLLGRCFIVHEASLSEQHTTGLDTHTMHRKADPSQSATACESVNGEAA